MIKINLVTDSLKKQEHPGLGLMDQIELPKEVLLGVGSIFIAGLLLVHAVLAGAWITAESRHISYQISWQKMLPDKSKIDSISQEFKDLQFKISTIDDFAVKKSMMSSRNLNVLSDLMPKGLWLKKIIWDDKAFVIEGSGFSKFNDEITIINDFVSKLNKDEGFIKDFSSIELNSVMRNKKGVLEVVDFKITAKGR